MKKIFQRVIFTLLMVASLLFGSIATSADHLFVTPVYAVPGETTENDGEPNSPNTSTETEADQSDEEEDKADEDKKEDEDEQEPICQQEAGSVSWIICPILNSGSRFIDRVYGFIEQFLIVKPLIADTTSPIFQVWSYMRDLTNIVFIIFILIVIYSQLTGLGINNYGVKRVLPRLIIAVIMVNLSYIACSLLVDTSNIIGSSITDFLKNIQASAQQNSPNLQISWTEFAGYFTGGAAIAAIGTIAAGGIGAIFWMVLLALIGAIISLAIGIITVSLRQGVISILVMIAPLAFVAYLLPNTEKWFEKWKNIFFQMLFFYPMFAFLFGASQLAGWAIIAAAKDNMFEVLLGLAIQVLPLVLSASLLKMSGSILGKISSGLDRLSNPARGALGRWSDGHVDKARQHYLRNNRALTGARLRNYLAERQKRRELDATNSRNINEGRINERALKRLAGYTGRDEFGNETYKKRPNRDTLRAKEASLQATLAANAQKMLNNNLSEFGDIFNGKNAGKLAGAHAEAYVDSMAQTFRAENIAQSDQDYLLNRYMKAVTDQTRKPYEYNRLVRSASGGLNHIGEATIMGQVIKESAEIEGRRRREALIMVNKFGVPKRDFRGMVFDTEHINDNGYETDANGKVIQDDQYRFMKDENGNTYKHQEWSKYIAINKDTGVEVDKATYDSFSEAKKKQYKKVRFMEIKDDNGDVVQKVFEDDAGYMKELLTKDVMIGDPINRRYNISYGLAHAEGETTGGLRRYHSRLSDAMLESKYSEHDAGVTAMLTSQANQGYLTSIGQYNIANLQSLAVAAKPSRFLQSDAFVINDLANIFSSIKDPERFDYYFPEQDIKNYRNVNGEHLDGMRFNEELQKWEKIANSDPTLTVEDQRNYLKHGIFAKAMEQMYSFVNRRISPNTLDNQKGGTADALEAFVGVIGDLAVDNLNDSIPVTERIAPNEDITTKKHSADDILNAVQSFQAQIRALKGQAKQPTGTTSGGASRLNDDLTHANYVNDLQHVIDDLNDLCRNSNLYNTDVYSSMVRSNFESNPRLRDYLGDAENILSAYADQRVSSTEEAIDQTTNSQEYREQEAERLQNLHQEIISLIDSIIGSSPDN